jgi:hypothetical protein
LSFRLGRDNRLDLQSILNKQRRSVSVIEQSVFTQGL